MSMDYRILRIILGGVLLLVAAFALGTRLAEWDQEQVQPDPPPAEMEDGKKLIGKRIMKPANDPPTKRFSSLAVLDQVPCDFRI